MYKRSKLNPSKNFPTSANKKVQKILQYKNIFEKILSMFFLIVAWKSLRLMIFNPVIIF